MMPDEKEQLLALLDSERKWCKGAEALDANGAAVRYDDGAAVAWDLTGTLCHLFGWQRACALFGQIDRHVNGKQVPRGWPVRDVEMDAMRALQEFNDHAAITFDKMRECIETIPVWHGTARRSGPAARNEFVSTTQK